MEKTDVVAALAALAQDNRLDVFRLLVEVGPEGMPAGAVATALDLAPNTLTFHFDRLRTAGLVTELLRGFGRPISCLSCRFANSQSPHALALGNGLLRPSPRSDCCLRSSVAPRR